MNYFIQWLQYGLLQFSVWQSIGVLLLLTHMTIISVTIFLHRAQAHLALELHPAVSHFFRFWLWLTTGMQTKEWVAVHRKHHTKSDRLGDPHSPHVNGIYTVLFAGTELYRQATHQIEDMNRYGKGTPDDWLERNIYVPFSKIGIIFMLLINIVLMGLAGVAIWSIQMMWIPFFAAGVINGVGHHIGYRNFITPELSRNIVPIGFLIGGEELHNNHHAYPHAARFSSRWFEIDIGWFYIRILKFLRLAKSVSLPSSYVIDPQKKEIDIQTVQAIVCCRVRILTTYIQKILIPIARSYQKICAEINIARMRRILFLKISLLQKEDQEYFNGILERIPTLKTLYQYQNNLQSIWEDGFNNHVMIQKLRKWCHNAQQSNIPLLAQYARTISQISLKRSEWDLNP